MEQLEMAELAPYLPYKLRIKRGARNLLMNTGQGSSTHWIGIKSVISWANSTTMVTKPYPILKPTERLTQSELLEAGFTTHLDYLTHEIHNPENKGRGWEFKKAPYEMISYLISQHYDVFGLIERGLAVSEENLILAPQTEFPKDVEWPKPEESELFFSVFSEPLKKLMDRVLANEEITIDYKNKKAYVNKWIGENSEEIPFWYAEYLIWINVIGCHSGNLETGERHFNFTSR